MTGRLSTRVARIEATTGGRLPLGRPLERWSDADLAKALGVSADVSDDELRRIVEAGSARFTSRGRSLTET